MRGDERKGGGRGSENGVGGKGGLEEGGLRWKGGRQEEEG